MRKAKEDRLVELNGLLFTRDAVMDAIKAASPQPGSADNETIGAAVRCIRQAQRLTLAEVSRATGLSISLLSQVERAESSASISTLIRIARAFGVPVSKLVEGVS
jgi:DNA-binding XRE family transcriptional regulator